MDIYTKILDFLRSEYKDNHLTYKDLENKYDISYSYLRELITGAKKPERLSLEYFFKLFPNATVNLGSRVSSPNNQGNVAVVNNGVQKVIPKSGGSGRALLDRIMACPDIPPDVKVKIYTLSSELEEED